MPIIVKPIEYLMRQHNATIDHDMLSVAASRELIIATITGLVPDAKDAQEQITGVLNTLQQGGTVCITNPRTDVDMVFQVKRRES